MFENAVFQGGGVKGIALVGALKRIEELGVKFNAVGGTSAGSIVAALYAAGYTADEMKQLLDATNFEQLLDKTAFMQRISFLKNKGIYSGQKIYDWMYSALQKKGVTTFSDLKKIKLKIVASDLTNREVIILDDSSQPGMKVAEAVRMSIGIPLFFTPYKLGERLVVDGGILSNYPLFIFDDPSKTVGFKLISITNSVPSTPDTWVEYFFSIINTMMDAHDKHDEKQSSNDNTINIDNAGIPTTKFELTTTEKNLLYQNGYYAASQFLNNNVEVSTNMRDKFIKIEAPFSNTMRVDVPKDVDPKEQIRVSISGLFRIYVDGKYLLVKGNRIKDQFQPVGGVFKRLPKSTHHLAELGVLDDDKVLIDDESRDDLRIRVPFEVLPKFLEWYRKGSGREITPEREFREELLETNILPRENFKYIYYEHFKTHVSGIKRSEHYKCNEVLIAEIYDLSATFEQSHDLRELIKRENDEYIWVEESLIQTKGYDEKTKSDVARISETASWILR